MAKSRSISTTTTNLDSFAASSAATAIWLSGYFATIPPTSRMLFNTWPMANWDRLHISVKDLQELEESIHVKA